MDNALQKFSENGYLITEPILSQEECSLLSANLVDLKLELIGSRKLLDLSWCKLLAEKIRKSVLIGPMLPDFSVAVQCNFFEKSLDHNWLVSIHQDFSIPVAEKIDHADLHGWSEKEGAIFVQPPSYLLEELVIVRIHVDDCGSSDGPVRVVPGSHRNGRMTNSEALKMRDEIGEAVCSVASGGALVMKPLLLHASSKSTGDSKRRVLHFIFGPRELPFGLKWGSAI